MTATTDHQERDTTVPATGEDGGRLTGADLAPLAIVFVVYLFLVFLCFNQVEEDAYIYFRVAENIADGHGYVFNRGGEAVEVGSSNLWLLLMVLLAKTPISMVWGAKFLGVTCGVGVLSMTYALSRRLSSDPLIPMFASLLTAATAPFLFWSQRGLETPLHMLLLVTLVYVTIDRSRFKYALAILALMVFGRPETPLLLAGLIPALFLCKVRFREMVLPASILVGMAFLVELARYVYFGDLMPQPFYLKMGRQGALGIGQVARYFLACHIPLIALPLLISVFRKSFWSAKIIIVFGYACAFLAWPSLTHDVKPYFRFIAPAMPLIWILLTHGFQHAFPGRAVAKRCLVYAYCCFVWIFGALLPNLHSAIGWEIPWPMSEALRAFGNNPVEYTRATATKIRRPHEPNLTDKLFLGSIESNYQWRVGEFVDQNYPNGIRVLYDQMGQTPYRAGSDKTFVDSFGLTDKRTGYHTFLSRKNAGTLMRVYRRLFSVAVSSRTAKGLVYPGRKEILDQLFQEKPDLIMLNGIVALRAGASITASIADDPRLKRDYRKTFTLHNIIALYERKGLRRTTKSIVIPDGLTVARIQETPGAS